MKHLRMLSLAVITAALVVSAGTASATTLTSPKGTVYTGSIHAEDSNLSLSGSFVTISCSKSELDGAVTSHGEAVTTKISLEALSFEGCNYEATVKNAGTLEVHTDSASVDGNGTITWTGLELSLHTSVGVCVYTTINTPIGTLEGSDVTRANWNTNSEKLPRTGGSFLCGPSSKLEARYEITTPSTLSVD